MERARPPAGFYGSIARGAIESAAKLPLQIPVPVVLGRKLRPSRMVLVVVAPKGAASATSDERGAMGVDMDGSR